jgi:hypothetical protein
MSNLAKTFAVLMLLFFGMHVISGYYYCEENFCPGDRESDWVYEYTDDTGKRFIVIDGTPIPKEQYQERLGIGPYSQDTR